MAIELIDVFEKIGFVDEDRVETQIAHLSKSEYRDLNTVVTALLRENPRGSYTPSVFNFLASASLRGDKCCTVPECRLSRIDDLGRFAALYADRLFLPLLTGEKDDDEYGRHLLEGSVRIALRMRPLIDAGLVVPISTSPSLCTECDARLSPVYEHAFQNGRQLMRLHRSSFRAKVIKRRLRKLDSLEIHVEGPAEFLQEKGNVFITCDIPDWASKLRPNVWQSIPGPLDEYSQVMRGLFAPSAKDFLLHNVMGRHLGATYLTNLKGEADFFAVDANEVELMSRRVEAFVSLKHRLPIFEGMTIHSLVRLRNNEPDSFRNYRNALASAVSECERAALKDGATKDVFQDILRPQLEALQARDLAEKRNRRIRLATRVGLGAAGGFLASVGALMCGIPQAIGGLIGGAVTCLNPAASEDVAGALVSSTEVKSNSMYYLLEANRRRTPKERNNA